MPAFTTIATAASLAATAASTGASFAQAGKQRKLQREAQANAEKAMAEAKKKLDVNFYEQLAIAKEPYELEREAMLSQGAMLTEAGRESERGAAATAGRVQMAQQQGQRQIAAEMSKDLSELARLTAAEESRLRDVGVGLNLEEVAGAQMAAANAEEAARQKSAEGVQGIVSLVGQTAQLAPLYAKNQAARQLGRMQKQATVSGLNADQFQQQLAAFGKSNPQYAQLASVGAMKPQEFQSYMIGLGGDYLKGLRGAFNFGGTPTNMPISAAPDGTPIVPATPQAVAQDQMQVPSWGSELNYFAPWKM